MNNKLPRNLMLMLLLMAGVSFAGCEMTCDADGGSEVEDVVDEVGDEIEEIGDDIGD